MLPRLSADGRIGYNQQILALLCRLSHFRVIMLTRIALTAVALLGLVGLGSSVYSGIVWVGEEHVRQRVQNEEPIQLEVEPLLQAETTSCGEAALTMAYNYAYPDAPLDEPEVISYAEAQGYFTPRRYPYTSPGNMQKIARHYARNVSNGRVLTSDQGLALLDRKLQEGVPVVIDVLVRRYDPDSVAHFIVVTGISVDAERGNAIMIHYNDPLTGTQEAARWGGDEGVWNAWQNNHDPGGSGWWLVFPKP
jgi:hypothetical protein